MPCICFGSRGSCIKLTVFFKRVFFCEGPPGPSQRTHGPPRGPPGHSRHCRQGARRGGVARAACWLAGGGCLAKVVLCLQGQGSRRRDPEPQPSPLTGSEAQRHCIPAQAGASDRHEAQRHCGLAADPGETAGGSGDPATLRTLPAVSGVARGTSVRVLGPLRGP